MTVRSVVLTALVVMVVAATIIVLRPTLRTQTPPPPSTITAPSGTATTPGTTTTGTGSPRPTPQTATTSQSPAASQGREASAVHRFVAEFAAAFARPTPARQQHWQETVPAYLDESTRAAVSTLTASMVPYRTVTGPHRITTGQFPHRATVPTDAGDLFITVCRDHSGEPGQGQRLLVCGIEMEHH